MHNVLTSVYDAFPDPPNAKLTANPSHPFCVTLDLELLLFSPSSSFLPFPILVKYTPFLHLCVNLHDIHHSFSSSLHVPTVLKPRGHLTTSPDIFAQRDSCSSHHNYAKSHPTNHETEIKSYIQGQCNEGEGLGVPGKPGEAARWGRTGGTDRGKQHKDRPKTGAIFLTLRRLRCTWATKWKEINTPKAKTVTRWNVQVSTEPPYPCPSQFPRTSLQKSYKTRRALTHLLRWHTYAAGGRSRFSGDALTNSLLHNRSSISIQVPPALSWRTLDT